MPCHIIAKEGGCAISPSSEKQGPFASDLPPPAGSAHPVPPPHSPRCGKGSRDREEKAQVQSVTRALCVSLSKSVALLWHMPTCPLFRVLQSENLQLDPCHLAFAIEACSHRNTWSPAQPWGILLTSRLALTPLRAALSNSDCFTHPADPWSSFMLSGFYN